MVPIKDLALTVHDIGHITELDGSKIATKSCRLGTAKYEWLDAT